MTFSLMFGEKDILVLLVELLSCCFLAGVGVLISLFFSTALTAGDLDPFN